MTGRPTRPRPAAARAPTARLLALALAALPTSPAAASECYEAGNRALDAGRTADAVAAFDAAAARPACAASRPGLLYNKAVALHALLDAGGPDALACRAAEAYRQVIALEPESRVGRASVEGARVVEPRCVAAAPPPDPPPPGAPSATLAAAPDHRLEWGLTAGAAAALGTGGVLLALALDAQADRDAADRRALAAAPGSAAEAAALDDFDAAAERTDALGLSGYIVGGVGVALAIGAVASWWIDDAPAATARVGPSGLGIGGVW
ncbi:MAG: hypothetical protein R3F65_19545 [bacterium]